MDCLVYHFGYLKTDGCSVLAMDLNHYLFTPLILFCDPHTLDLLPYYLSIANGTGGVGIFELFIFQCFV